ncbi:MAG TPA: hypothetical protein DCR87_00145 [Acidobacteria bacterium]|nr:hypothetical protein [Acidobacteriota bacterium]
MNNFCPNGLEVFLNSFFKASRELHKTCPYNLKPDRPENKVPAVFLSCLPSANNQPSKPPKLYRRLLLASLCLLLTLSPVFQPASGAVLSKFSQQQAASAQPYYLNPAREIELLKKILGFERNWKGRAGQELVIGILYQKGSSISSWIMEDWLNLLSQMSESDRQLEGVPISFQKIELDATSSLEAILIENKIHILYITPLETKNIARTLNEIVRICGKLKIGTFTAVPEYLDSGVAISFQLKDEKSQIVINLEASRAQGFDFSSQLLRLAKIKGKND